MRKHIRSREIDRWLDGELGVEKGERVGAHVKECHGCFNEVEKLRAFREILRTKEEPVGVSPSFEGTFWAKVYERQREPWYVRMVQDLEALIPTPSLAQVAAVLAVAFLTGSGGGILSAIQSGAPVSREVSPLVSFSGFREYKGIPQPAVSANYLKMVEENLGS